MTSVTRLPRRPLRLDPEIIEQLLGVAPPDANWLSSTMFPAENAFLARGDIEHFLVAHPDFWNSLPAHAAAIGIASPCNVQIVNVDPVDGDSDAMLDAKRRLRARYGRAINEQLLRDHREQAG